MLNLLGFIVISFSFSYINPWLEKKHLPAPAINIAVGLLIGPFVFGSLESSTPIHWISELSVMLMLFAAGLEIDWAKFSVAIKPGFRVGVMGIMLSFLFGSGVVFVMTGRIDEALYGGAALSATSIGLSVPLLTRYQLLNTRAGQILLTAAVIDDILALYLLSLIHSGFSANSGVVSILTNIVLSISGMVVVIFILSLLYQYTSRKLTRDQIFLRRFVVIVFMLTGAFVSDYLELSAAIGAFSIGAVLSYCDKPQKTPDATFFNRTSVIVSPFFFLAVGLQVAFLEFNSGHLITLSALLIIAAILGKRYSAAILFNQITKNERLLIGWSMVPRAEVAILIANIGLQYQHISMHTMVAIILMTAVTAVLAPLMVSKRAAIIGKN